jgi:hypothetical protein
VLVRITRVQRSYVISLLHMSATVLKGIVSSKKIVTLNGLSNNTKQVSRLSVERLYRGADKSLARPTSRCILIGGENISFGGSHIIYIYSTKIPPIMIINRIYETQNLLSL